MTVASRLLMVLVIVLFAASPSFAESTIPAGVGGGFGMGLSVLGAGLGIGLIGFAALSGIARQPEQAGRISGSMILLAALVEGAAILSLILCFVVANK